MARINNLPGLCFVNLELSSVCNKNCWMCGRRKVDRDFPEIATHYGFIDYNLVKKISKQLSPNIVVAFHWNGEPLLYPLLGRAIELFKQQIKVLDTNGKLLVEQMHNIIGKLDTITISIIERDSETDEQYKVVSEFLSKKGTEKPYVIFRYLGVVDAVRWGFLAARYNCLEVNRTLHNPMGSFDYKKKVIIPEIGICLEMLSHIAIDRFGNVSPCVRFDPEKKFVIGNLNDNTLSEIWNGDKRQKLLELHKLGKRKEIEFCNKCSFWGCQVG